MGTNTSRKIPLLSHDGYADHTDQNVSALQLLETSYGGDSAIAVASTQLAVQMCLEVLGTRTHLIPCILPVNAPPDTLAAVLRAGAHPMLLDINGGSLQMDVEQLKTALQGVPGSIVVLTRPGGQPVEERLLEAVQDVPTVIDTRLPPKQEQPAEDLVGSFTVFDFKSRCGTGALIRHKYEEQQKMLRLMRSGVMGHSGTLPKRSASYIVLQSEDKIQKAYEEVGIRLRNELLEYSANGIIPFELSPSGPTPLFVFVPNNAKRIVAQLKSHQIGSAVASYPLHLLSEVRQRFQEIPEYPVAEKVMNQVIALPVHAGVAGREKEIARIVGEVANG